MTANPVISIIFPVKNEGDNVKTNYLFEVIVVNDKSTDNCCGFLQTYYQKDRVKLIYSIGIGAANARNLGAKNVSGD